MVNRPRIKGTAAESALVAYLRSNGWPYAERRALSGTTDKGDVAGTGPLVWECKAAGTAPQIPAWLLETETERINAGAEYGILIVKTRGLGDRRVGQWLAVMRLDAHEKLMVQSNVPVIVSPESRFYSTSRLAGEFALLRMRRGEIVGVSPDGTAPAAWPLVAAQMMPPGSKELIERHYRVMRLEEMVPLLHGAGYGESGVS